MLLFIIHIIREHKTVLSCAVFWSDINIHVKYSKIQQSTDFIEQNDLTAAKQNHLKTLIAL